MEIVVYGPLRAAVGDKRAMIDVDGDTVEDVLNAFVEAYPRASDQLYAEDGSLRPSVRITCNGEPIEPDAPYPDEGGELAVFPAIQGG